jgi:hypothetical protein
MASRSRLFSKIAKDVDTTGNLTAAAISSDVSFGATVYDSNGVLPYSGNTTGDQAYVKSNNRFYIWDSAGWYNVALINRAPTISSVLDSYGASSPFSLSIDGTATTITITATDSDGDPLTYTATADADFNGLATVTGSGNEFRITPFSQDSATTESGTITFKATDGINISSSISTFTLVFASEYWDETVLSIGTSSTNSLDNSTFVDRSTNTHTVTPTGTPVQTAFHPYLDNWSVEFDGNTTYLSAPWSSMPSGTEDFTIEFWIYETDTSDSSWGVLGNRVDGANNFIIYYGFPSVGYYLLFDDTEIQVGSSGGRNLNQWSHHAIVRDGDDFTYYINGQVHGTGTYAGKDITKSFTDVLIGTVDTGGTRELINGSISNLRIIKGTALYTSAFTPPTGNLTAVSGTSLLTCQSNRFIDESTNGHTITVNGDPKVSAFNPFGQESEYSVGENKGSGYFDGTNDGLSIANDTTTQVKGDNFTFECWVYPEVDTGGAYAAIFSQGSSGVYSPLNVQQHNRSLAVGLSSTGSSWDVYFEDGGTFLLNSWNHIVVVRDNTNFAAFLNGIRVHNFTSSATLMTPTQPTNLGLRPAGDQDYQGYISDWCLVKGTANYDPTSASITLPTAPVTSVNSALYLPMDNAGIFDKTGNYALTLVGDVATSTTQTKYANTAMYFDGNDYIIGEMSDNLFFNEQSMTIECWIYPTALGGVGHCIFDTRSGFDSASLMIWIEGTELQVYIGDYSGASPIISGGTISVNQWSHIAFTRESGTNTNRLFINGTSTAINTIAWNQTSASGREYRLGQVNGFDRPFYGYMENFQILKGVAKYTENFTPPTQEQGRLYQATS